MVPKLSVIVLVACLAGCAFLASNPLTRMLNGKTPQEKVAAAQQAFTIANDSFARYVQAGVIDDKRVIAAWRGAQIDIDAALTLAKEYADTGDTSKFDQAWPTIVSRVNDFIILYSTKTKKPTTREALWTPRQSPSELSFLSVCSAPPARLRPQLTRSAPLLLRPRSCLLNAA